MQEKNPLQEKRAVDEAVFIKSLSKDASDLTKEIHDTERKLGNESRYLEDKDAAERLRFEDRKRFVRQILDVFESIGGVKAFRFINQIENGDAKPGSIKALSERIFEATLEDGAKIIVELDFNAYNGAYQIVHDGTSDYVPRFLFKLKYAYPVTRSISKEVQTDAIRQAETRTSIINQYMENKAVLFYSDSLDSISLPSNVTIPALSQDLASQENDTTVKELKETIQRLAKQLYTNSGSLFEDTKSTSEIIASFGYANYAKEYAKKYENK